MVTVTNFVPPVLGTVTSVEGIQFDVLSAAGVERVLILDRFLTGSYELAWDGSGWTQNFLSSTKVDIMGGQRYVVRRDPPWEINPLTLLIVAYDFLGAEHYATYIWNVTPPVVDQKLINLTTTYRVVFLRNIDTGHLTEIRELPASSPDQEDGVLFLKSTEVSSHVETLIKSGVARLEDA